MTCSTRPASPPRPRPVVLGWLGGAVLVGALLTGCSGGQEPQDVAASAGASAPAPPPASPATPAPSGSPTTTVVTSMTTFTAPSGNISCYLAPVQGSDPYARCDLKQTSWSEPEPEGGCDGRWGGGDDGFGSVGVGGGDAEYLCVGDEVADPSAQPLPYGSSIVMEPITCTSQESGMTCENSKTGHGFSAARAKAVLR